MAKASLQNVDKELDIVNKKITSVVIAHTQKVVSDMVTDLRAATPVDTGRAQASWSVVPTHSGYAVINSAPYIQYLNAGSSKQASPHFIERVALRYGKPVGAIVDILHKR